MAALDRPLNRPLAILLLATAAAVVAPRAARADAVEIGLVADDAASCPAREVLVRRVANCASRPIKRWPWRRIRFEVRVLVIPAGAVETSRPTTWDDPVYAEAGIRHFCVDNIPGAVPVTASAGYSSSIIDNILLIGRVGATGRVTGAHLDWRMNLFSRRIDPALLVVDPDKS